MAGGQRARTIAACALGFAAIMGCRDGDRFVANAPTLERIESTTSFGMCVGYCGTKLEIMQSGAVLTRIGREGRSAEDAPDQVTRAPLAAGEWNDFIRLASQADLGGLPSVMGCPDCADGGAESLTVVTAEGKRSISFEYGANIAAVAGLLEKVRAKRMAMTPTDR